MMQANFVFSKAQSWIAGTPVGHELLLELQRLAVNQIYRCAGFFRNGAVRLEKSDHCPPSADQVLALVDEMCLYINSNWSKSGLHLAAYAMWRLNWIHPFFGGNGRTARAFAYLVLCIREQLILPADSKNMPELIDENKGPYYSSLVEADQRYKASGQVDVGAMEEYLSNILALQLAEVFERMTGKDLG